jgi:ABC-type uncharacterized transport system substrate-binding protein
MKFHLKIMLMLLLVFPMATLAGVLEFSPNTRDFNDAVSSLRGNLSDVKITVQQLTDEYTVKQMAQAIQEQKPEIVVLFDNKSIRLYQSYIKEFRPQNPPAVVALMALQLEQAIVGIPNVMGISYEIPAVTTASRLRNVWGTPIRKVGVVYRASMEPFYQENKRFCKVENIDLVGQKVPDESSDLTRDLKTGLQNLIWTDRVDAIWIINDNKLLSAKLIKEIWIPFMKENAKPGIVGVEMLTQTKLGLAVTAILPDNVGLGAQAANLVYEIIDNGNKVDKLRIDLPLAVIQVLNTTLSRKIGTLRKDAEKSVDRVVE